MTVFRVQVSKKGSVTAEVSIVAEFSALSETVW